VTGGPIDLLGRALRVLGVVIVVAYSALVMARVSGAMPPDAVTYLAAGERLNAGHPLYAISPGDRPITTEVAGNPAPLLSPPGIAVIWRPLAALGEWTVTAWWLAGSALFILALALVVWRAWPTIAIVLLVLDPIAWLVAFGNVHTYIAAGFVALWFVRDRPWAAAVLAVSMTAVKLTPAPLVLWAARDRRMWLPILVTSGAWLAAILVLAPGALPAYVDLMRTGSGGILWPVLILGLVATLGLPRRVAFAAAVVTATVATTSVGIHWLAVLPIALTPWVLPGADAWPIRRMARPATAN